MAAEQGQAAAQTPLPLSLPTVTQTDSRQQSCQRRGRGVATLPDTFAAPVTLVCQTNCRATHAVGYAMLHSFVGCWYCQPKCPRVTGCNKLQSKSSCCRSHQQRRVDDDDDDAASHNTPPSTPATPRVWTVECPQPDTVSLCLSVCLSI